MAARILIPADKCWSYYMGHIPELRSTPVLIAENEDDRIKVYMANEGNMMSIDVMEGSMVDGILRYTPIDGVMVSDYLDAQNEVGLLYQEYLFGLCSLECESDKKEEDELIIEEREAELDEASHEFLITLLGNFPAGDELSDITESLKDEVCRMLYEEFQISVYRPMILEDENGNEEMCEYPYPELLD